MKSVTNPEVERLAGAKYISLTTFRKDGTPVSTPVWVTTEEGYLIVITDGDSGKVKRLRRNHHVTIAPCDVRGNLQGDPVNGIATVISDPELIERAEHLLRQRYGLAARVMGLLSKLRGGRDTVVLAVTVTGDHQVD